MLSDGELVPHINGLYTEFPCEISSDSIPDYCSPWWDTYGFFFGDSSYQTVLMRVSEVDHAENVLGNVLSGSSQFVHTYPSDTNNGEPWIAYFTGGNRLADLQNNPNGRFRLEAEISLQSWNRNSPVATQIPILPVPYVGRADGFAQFEISAYDPDQQFVRFRLGSSTEYGRLNQITLPRIKSSGSQVVWNELAYNSTKQR